MIASGTDAKTAQSAARHSSLDMTLNVYGRTNYSALRQVNQIVGDLVLAPQAETCTSSNSDDSAKKTHQNSLTCCNDKGLSVERFASSPVSVAKQIKPLSGKLNPDNGFFIPKDSDNKELKETASQQGKSEQVKTGVETSETENAQIV